jgi:hypothetical protein
MCFEPKESLFKEFEMTNSGENAYCLGIQIRWNYKPKKIHLSQEKYLNDIVIRFKMDSCHLVITPFPLGFKLNKSMAPITTEDVIAIHDVFYKSVLGNLMHAMVCIRLDLVVLFLIFFNS